MKYKKNYSRKDIVAYLKGVQALINKAPTSRDLEIIPGPSPRTIIRRFGKWSVALKAAGIRPHTNQLMKGEKTFIRQNWHKMTDKQIANKLHVSETVIKYYRANFSLWKNRKGTARSTFRREAFKLYGEKCEVCGIPITEWHHIVPKSTKPEDWCILCPLCHEVITRKLVNVTKREDLHTILLPYIKNIYSDITTNLGNDSSYT